MKIYEASGEDGFRAARRRKASGSGWGCLLAEGTRAPAERKNGQSVD